MIVRAFVLAAGLIGGALSSQFPEFLQQYQQRLGGAVDALSEIVADFDASAQAEGLSRADALAQMEGTPFLDRRRSDMTRTFARHERLSANLAALQQAGPFMRAYHAVQFIDTEVASAALEDFKPAVPLTVAGGIFASVGFLAGLVLGSVALRLLLWPFGLRRRVARGT